MARSESEREDLLREATALIERAEIRVSRETDSIVVGFRHDGSASFFFGADPVLQFNSTREFRRAYIGGLLYKAERGRLISLRRERTEVEVTLVRNELQPNETDTILAAAHAKLMRLNEALTSNAFTLIGQVPPHSDIIRRVLEWFALLPPRIHVARAPNAR